MHKPPRPPWEEGIIDLQLDHMELCYGSRQVPVARVGRDPQKHIRVQFLVELLENEAASQRMLKDVCLELSYYLFDVAGAHSWAFARFHCEAAANFSSRVRWFWRPGAIPQKA
jgi:hypothetical protein